jgi:DNA-binding NarL/FixJ family response regulator
MNATDATLGSAIDRPRHTVAGGHSVSSTRRPDVVTVVVGRLEPLLGRGVKHLLLAEPSVRVLASDLGLSVLESTIERRTPQVAILADTVDYELVARLKARRPATRLVVIAADPTVLYGTILLAAGVTCLAHSTPLREVITAVVLAGRGECVFIGSGGSKALRATSARSVLSRREAEVLEHLSHGSSYAQIGQNLHIAPETVRKHATNICRKLNVTSRRELVGRFLHA